MNTFQLKCFLAVADMLNFARAAEYLHITQPAVTQQIQSLEKELNVKLFHRTTRTVRLTQEGSLFLHDAQHMVAISQRAIKRFENPHSKEIQLFSLGCYSYAQLFLLPQVLKRLAERFPALHPRLRVIAFQHLYRLLEENEVDAVIGFKEPDSRKISALYREIRKVPVVCICAPDNPLAQRTSVALEELKSEKLVLFDPIRAQADAARLQGQLMDGRDPSDFYFCDSPEEAVLLTEAGFGISILPDLFIPPTLSISRLPIRGIGSISFGIYYKSLQKNPVLKELIQIMKEVI